MEIIFLYETTFIDVSIVKLQLNPIFIESDPFGDHEFIWLYIVIFYDFFFYCLRIFNVMGIVAGMSYHNDNPEL